MRYCSYRCKRGYEVALQRAETATTDEERRRWQKTAQIWLSRWKGLVN